MEEKTIAFVGGSFTSLLMALYLAENKKAERILIIEREKAVGGLYKSFKYSNNNIFDIGVHVYTETGNKSADELVFSLLDEDEWEILDGHYRDLSGTYYNNQLQLNTPYVDLRNLDEETKERYMSDLNKVLHMDTNVNNYSNCRDFLLAKFGEAITDEVMEPIIFKHYGKSSSELDSMATSTIPIGRIVIYDEDELSKLMDSPAIRARIAFPDQLRLPDCYLRTERLLYPKKFGIYNLVDALMRRLKKAGVEVLTETHLSSIDMQESECKSITLKQGDNEWQENNIQHLYWNAGIPLFAQYANLDLPKMELEFLKSVFVNLVLNKQPNSGELYYYNCFDEQSPVFRITNYSSYCPGANMGLGNPICVTMWPKDGDEQDMTKLAEAELRRMNIIDDSHQVLFAKAESFGRGFPNPTIDYVKGMDTIRNTISAKNYKNIDMIGMLSHKNLFYLNEVIAQAFKLLDRVSV